MHILPKKSLGQNFLIDKNIRRKIIEACRILPVETVLEIGSGKGEMVEFIAKRAKRLYALELDCRLHDSLAQALAAHKNVKLIKNDILKFNINRSIKEKQVKVIGNIPYYISSPIIEHLIKFRKKIIAAYITVQKEFALRVVAVPGSKQYGAFSCFVQYYFIPRILFNINRGCFKPAPKVDSVFLELIPRLKPAVQVSDSMRLFKIIRAAFNQRRKTLRNSLSGLVDKVGLEVFLAEGGLGRNIRPEDLSLVEFARLADI